MNKALLPLLIILALACQCSQLPTPEPTAVHTPVPSSTMASYPTAGHTATFMPSPSPQPTATNTATATPEPTGTAVPTVTPSPTLAPSPVATVAQNYYIVQKDDWLIKIAQFLYGGQYGWEWRCLYEVNRAVIGDDPNLIYRGQKLVGIRECGE